jgi:hypothetical protein
MIPCGRCTNCRNGAAGICLAKDPAPVSALVPISAPASAPPRIVARYCRCGQPLYGKVRFCDRCRRIRNRETARRRMAEFRKLPVTKNRAAEARKH